MEKKIIRDGGEVLAVSYNNWVFFSQFTGRGASGTQVRAVISSLLQAAEKADVKPDGFVKMTVLLSDMDIYARFLADYQELVGGSFPALAGS